uniref:Thrombospondin, type I, domain containing 7Ba n=1 Tax=Sphaeramia orbicularis TaxID=375764 RepID=A0A672YXA7_9TELE
FRIYSFFLCTKDSSPLTFQTCVMPKDCQTSDWSPWSPCSKTCRSTDLSPGYRVRSRIMTQIPVGGGKRCPPREEKEACNILEITSHVFGRYQWRTTDWGECRVSPLLSQQDRRLANISILCGGGVQTRKTYCVQIPDDSAPHHRKEGKKNVSRPVDARLCAAAAEPPPSSVRGCSVPCRHHCLLSAWSHWGPCVHENCKEPQGKKGFRLRRRQVLWVSSSPPQTCPHLVESVPCEEPVCYQWHVEELPCVPAQSPCGPGRAVHNLTCVDSEGADVSPSLCGDDPPPSEVPCQMPCPADCVVGSWSSWSPCSHSCATKTAEGRQSRSRAVLALPGKGKRCPAAPALEEWRVCNDHPCMVFYWEAWPWGPCIQDASMNLNGTAFWNSSSACAVGVQIRKVTCMKMNAGPVINKRCPDSTRPETVRPCVLPCKKDCMVTPFSEWTACPSTCTLSHRSRPKTKEDLRGHRMDCNPLDLCSPCLRWAGPTPPQIRDCRVPCKDDCTLTAWSRFSECAGCGSFRRRKRSLTGRSKKKEHCLNETLYPLEDTEACPCQEFLSQPFGNWSACVLPGPTSTGSQQGWMGHRQVKECGQGLRYRAVACMDPQGRPVEPTVCTDTGFMVEVCHVPCPSDCKLSDWSPWSACSASCGSGLKIRSKWLREKAFNGGRPCPKLDLKNQVYQAVPCHSECSQYEWRTEPWSICTINSVDDSPACGEGVQSRKIRSNTVICGPKSDPDHFHIATVEDSLCEQEESPPTAQVCTLACPNHCVMAPWGPWSPCPSPCDQNSTRTRTRTIVRPPASEKSVCPESVQSEPCVLNSTCFWYQYRVSDWSTCQLSENAICGRGLRLRLLDCVRGDGKTVEFQKCEEVTFTQFSLFKTASFSCLDGQCVRTRRVLQEAHQEGRPCVGQLHQSRACPIRPCYMWLLSDWSVCAVEGAECGEGFRRRSISCVVHWGDWPESPSQPVQDELCGDKLKQQVQQEMEQPCFVPCPGDCHLTEWSSWSSCQLTCLEGRSFESTGRRARSRAVIIQVMENQGSCPQQVFETQPCKGGKCHSYQWRTGGWSNNERAVWCQRSDGVNVTGGCFLQKRPTTVRHCHPPCTKPFSHCTPSGVCGCEKGYTEVMTTHGFLDYCTRTPGMDANKKADVKTNSGRFRPGPSQAQDLFSEWTLRPVGPDGRVKVWVYAVTAVGFILILFIIALSFLVW